MIEHQVSGGHVPVLAVRRGDLIPTGVGLGDDLHQRGILVGREDLVIPSRPGAQVQGAFTGLRTGEIRVHLPDLCPVVIARRGEVDAGCHGGGHRSPEDAALHQPLPFSGFIDGMHQRQFIFAVQRFSHLCR